MTYALSDYAPATKKTSDETTPPPPQTLSQKQGTPPDPTSQSVETRTEWRKNGTRLENSGNYHTPPHPFYYLAMESDFKEGIWGFL